MFASGYKMLQKEVTHSLSLFTDKLNLFTSADEKMRIINRFSLGPVKWEETREAIMDLLKSSSVAHQSL